MWRERKGGGRKLRATHHPLDAIVAGALPLERAAQEVPVVWGGKRQDREAEKKATKTEHLGSQGQPPCFL